MGGEGKFLTVFLVLKGEPGWLISEGGSLPSCLG